MTGGEPRYQYIDISVPISAGMVTWPSDPPVVIEPFKTIARGDHSNVSHLHLGSHTGSHIDAPVHFGLGERGAGEIPFDHLVGRAVVVEGPDLSEAEPGWCELICLPLRLVGLERAPVRALLRRPGAS